MVEKKNPNTIPVKLYMCKCGGRLLLDEGGRRVAHSRPPPEECTTSGCARFEQVIRSGNGPTFDALRALVGQQIASYETDCSIFEQHSDEWRVAPQLGQQSTRLQDTMSKREPYHAELKCERCEARSTVGFELTGGKPAALRELNLPDDWGWTLLSCKAPDGRPRVRFEFYCPAHYSSTADDKGAAPMAVAEILEAIRKAAALTEQLPPADHAIKITEYCLESFEGLAPGLDAATREALELSAITLESAAGHLVALLAQLRARLLAAYVFETPDPNRKTLQ